MKHQISCSSEKKNDRDTLNVDKIIKDEAIRVA